HEELFLFTRLAEALLGDASRGTIAVSWRYREKQQPPGVKFQVPAVDAPNVAGARIFGLVPGAPTDAIGRPDVAALREAVERGRVAALYVFDPGPDGSLGDVQWIVEARTRGALGLLVVQCVLMTDLARAADFVLPGASYLEKEASYTNQQGRLQGTSRAFVPPGDAMDDWQILVNAGVALGVKVHYASAAHVSSDIAACVPDG